ncbi:MAG: hypothetical protein JW787_18540 [Sedimentisphaerales bacterium]|nr:hypothetical protein [Sedimentisphaerales bacterium]
MAVKNKHFRSGVTLIELVVTVLAAIILMIGIVSILAAGHRNYRTMFDRTTSEVVRNAYEARIIFDRIVRKSVYDYYDLNEAGDSLVVFFYPDPDNIETLNDHPTMYAMFYKDGSDLKLQQDSFTGWPPPTITPEAGDSVIAKNVTALEFTVVSASIRMALTLDDTNNPGNKNALSTLKLNVVTTAIRHNKLPD